MCGATVNVWSDCLRKKRPRRRRGKIIMAVSLKPNEYISSEIVAS